MKQITLNGITWDTDGESPEELELPNDVVIEVDDDFENEEDDFIYAIDCASDEYGYCVESVESWQIDFFTEPNKK